MGSVRALYTTGDNDPEIEPEQYYRHYLYCDDCGSFELEPWRAGPGDQAVEPTRRRVAKAVVLAAMLALGAGCAALDLPPWPAVIVLLAIGTALHPVLRRVFWWPYGTVPQPWRFLKVTLPILVASLLGFFLGTVSLNPAPVLLAAMALAAGLVIWRAVLGSGKDYRGLRCRRCDATYAYGTAFFTDLDSNPREQTVDQVPLPLGSTPYERGESVPYQPPAAPGRLPR